MRRHFQQLDRAVSSKDPVAEQLGATKVKLCIYCPAELTAATRWAHVWPASMGGRLKSRQFCCDDCNNAIARTESNLFEALRHSFASVGAVNDQRAPVEILIERNGRDFVLADGNAVLRVRGVRFDPDTKNIVVPLPAGLDEQAIKAAKSFRSHGLGPDDVHRFRLEPGDPEPMLPDGPTPDEYDLSVGRKIAHRQVIVKMALELLAFHRHDLAIRGELLKACQFARYGKGDFRIRLDTCSRGSGLVPVDALPEAINAIETWTVGASIFFRAIFLGPIVFTGTLTSEWDGESFRAAYAFDARNPTNVVVSTFMKDDGRALATWFMRNEMVHCSTALEATSCKLALERAKIKPVREAPPGIDALREAMRARLTAMPPKKRT
jgi:hypothetical protein